MGSLALIILQVIQDTFKKLLGSSHLKFSKDQLMVLSRVHLNKSPSWTS